ncbi:MAG TPA: peptidase domain-containing ABC transporter [Edaphocola sp.]|nr:peptidase domain-containing ABC transporter [Edaphocola sp.]
MFENKWFVFQRDAKDCAPSCLKMIAQYYGKSFSLEFLREKSFLTKEGVSLFNISNVAKELGFETLNTLVSIEALEDNPLLPAILHWGQNHFVVLFKIKNRVYHIADPEKGIIKLNKIDFASTWLNNNSEKGIALFLEPTDSFYQKKNQNGNSNFSIKIIRKYLAPFKISIFWLILISLISSGLSYTLPFISQSMFDNGIMAKNITTIHLLIFSQLCIIIGTLVIDVFRNWILLYLGTKISIKIISDYFKKLFNLPIRFFDTKLMGDINQRIADNERIEIFLTSQALTTAFSILTISTYLIVLAYYNLNVFLLYIILTSIAILWSSYWLKKRKAIDYIQFRKRSENQENIYENISGVTEIKLNNLENHKREQWEKTQMDLLKTNVRILKIDQLQLTGYEFINQIKNLSATFIVAILVVNTKMTIGEMIAISFIVGQLNAPVNQLIIFLRAYQNAQLSFERLNEIQNEAPEEDTQYKAIANSNATINIQNLSFQYEGPQSPFVLENINLTISKGKITAIVGASGSGKTTLMKLLLRFYEPTSGNIFIGDDNLNIISPKSLRQNCGVVMQDGYIFADSIERNIATSDENINAEKLENAVITANIAEYINELPLKFKTKIGASGNGISGGQKQRMLIARAVYKNPLYIFFDEATSALDAENEKIIHDNLQTFFKGKTVLIIAHRLSTVKNADQIIVLDKGNIAETGTHEELTKNRGKYFELVKNQLELGD